MSEVDLLKERAALAAHAITAVHPYRLSLTNPGSPDLHVEATPALMEHLNMILNESIKDLYAYYAFRVHQNH